MEEEEKEIWRLYAFLTASDVRREIALSLDGGPLTPTQIADDKGLNISHVSQKLGELSERGVIECINPERRKGRLYTLTEEGMDAIEKLEDEG